MASILAERDDLDGALEVLSRAESRDGPKTGEIAAFLAAKIHQKRGETESAIAS